MLYYIQCSLDDIKHSINCFYSCPGDMGHVYFLHSSCSQWDAFLSLRQKNVDKLQLVVMMYYKLIESKVGRTIAKNQATIACKYICACVFECAVLCACTHTDQFLCAYEVFHIVDNHAICYLYRYRMQLAMYVAIMYIHNYIRNINSYIITGKGSWRHSVLGGWRNPV